jgi:hypothetical protein
LLKEIFTLARLPWKLGFSARNRMEYSKNRLKAGPLF